MGGVAPGSPVSASNTNSAFIEKNADDATVGKLGLSNVDSTNSGNSVVNTQGEINGLNTFLGRTAAAGPISKPNWTNNDVGISTDDVKTRADLITAKFNGTTGHKHTGTAGDGARIAGTSVWSISSAQPTIADNQSSPSIITSWPVATICQVNVEFQLIRNGLIKAGKLRFTTDMTSAVFTYDWEEPFGDCGITFSTTVEMVGGISSMTWKYTSTNTGFVPKILYEASAKQFPA